MYERVLVTLDGSDTSEAVLPEVERLAAGQRTLFTLLIVGELPRATAETPHPLYVAAAPVAGGTRTVPAPRVFEDRGQALERAREEMQAYLEDKARLLREKGIAVDTEVAFGDPAEEILACARARGVGLIMMATHGRSALAQVVFGSVAGRVLGSGVRPVLLVRPDHLSVRNQPG